MEIKTSFGAGRCAPKAGALPGCATPRLHSFYITSETGTSGKVVAIQVHHLVPRSHEVLHKRLLRVVTCIDFRDCPELGVRTEDKVDTGAGPLEFARRAIAALKHAFGVRG